MATLHLIHGYIGFGKTTFAKKLANEKKAIRFSPDEWMIELHGINPPANKYQEYNQAIESLIQKLAEEILANGFDVIFDFGFWSRTSRDEVREWAESINVDYILYSLRTPLPIARQRVLDRTQRAGNLFIDENAFNSLFIRFKDIQPDEKYIAVEDPPT